MHLNKSKGHIVLCATILILITIFSAPVCISQPSGDEAGYGSMLAPTSPFNPISISEEHSKNLADRAILRDVCMLIGKYLHLGISSHTIIPAIKEHIEAVELAASVTSHDNLLVGFKVDEMFYAEKENAYYLPVYQDGVRKFYYKFYVNDDLGNKHMTIPRGDREKVYVKIEKIEKNGYHTYTEVTGKERDEIFQEILSDVMSSIEKYYALFRESLNGEKLKDNSFPEGYSVKAYKKQLYGKLLFRDENNVLWILKKTNHNSDGEIGALNIPEQEMLGYLLSKERANFTEIRFLDKEEMKGIEYFKYKMDLAGEYYLTRVVSKENGKIEDLVDQDPYKANSSLFVAYIFMRKWDPHLLNIAHKKDIPVAVDHDAVFQQAIFPLTKIGLMRYYFNYLKNTILPITHDRYNIKTATKEGIQEKRDAGKAEEGYGEAVSILGKKIREKGLGNAFVRAEMLDEQYIKESIIKFKNIKNTRKIAKKARFSDKELDRVVSLIKENQLKLGYDVNELLKILTGRDYGLDKLDDDVPNEISKAQRLLEEFKKRFPENYEMMLAMFGEFVIKDSGIKKYFDKLMRCHKGQLSKNRALYFASLLRVEEGFTPGEYKLRYIIEEGENMTFGSVAFDELEDEFLMWAVKKNILLDDFSLAYGLYIKKKKEMLHLREYGKETKMTIRAGKKIGEELYKEYTAARTGSYNIQQSSYKGDVVEIDNMRWLELPSDVPEDIQIGVIDNADDGKYDLYIFTRNRKCIDKINQQVQGDFRDLVPIGYASLRIENNIPIISARQPRFYLPHYLSSELKQYVQEGIFILSRTIENQIQEIIQSDQPVGQIRSFPASWYLVNSKIAESTAQRYYMDVPAAEGYSLVALSEPLSLSKFFKVNFVYEKDLEERKVQDMSYTTTDVEKEQKHAEMFKDIVKLIQAKKRDKQLIFVLGTSWIKGYVKDRNLQYDALNPLITSVRRFCENRCIKFIINDDKNLLSEINEAKRNTVSAKVVVLAGKDVIDDKNFENLVKNGEVFFVGVDNSKLTADSYMRIMEMMTLTIKLAYGKKVDLDAANMLIQKSDRFPNMYIFIPDAEPMDYETLKEIYRAQIFA